MKSYNENMWVASLSTGDGAVAFLDNFAKALQKRYGCLIYIRPPKSYPDDISRYDLLENTNTRAPIITHARHRTHLESALRFLEAFLETCELPLFP